MKMNWYLRSESGGLMALGKMSKQEAQKIADNWTEKYGKRYTIV